MRTPKTVKGYLKMFIQISRDVGCDLKDATPDDCKFLNIIRAGIQNELGEDEFGTMKKCGLKWKE